MAAYPCHRGPRDAEPRPSNTTIHKSQGSEYPAVVIPLSTQHYPMLQRNLVCTDERIYCRGLMLSAKPFLGG